VYLRPGVSEFVEWMAASYELAVWTASSPDYARFFAARLFAGMALTFVWASDRCTLRFDPDHFVIRSIKDFRKLRREGIDLNRVLMVDDIAQNHVRNYGNLVQIKSFEGNPADRELFELVPYLESIANRQDYRSIDKRYWRSSPSRCEPTNSKPKS
jgi:RNA polymerase II subunit A small phosphatase-like protein